MNKRSLLVGFGLGLLLAGFVSMMFNARAGWRDRWEYRYSAPPSESADGAINEEAYYRGPRYMHHGMGMFFPFMILPFLCLVPIIGVGIMAGILHRMKHRMWRRWGHHRWHGGEPTYYV